MTIDLYTTREEQEGEISKALIHIILTCNHMRGKDTINPSDYLEGKLQELRPGLDPTNKAVYQAMAKALNDAYGTTL